MKLPRILSGLMLMALSSPSWAWWNGGHEAVGVIAWHQLTPAQQQKLSAILSSHPGGSSYQKSFPLCCTWPDAIRGSEDDRPSWHYKDKPFWDNVAPHPLHEEETAVEAMATNLAIANDPLASNSDKAKALAWIGHVVGDVHQPLHATTRCSPPHPNGDRGGNDFRLNLSKWSITPGNLHKFWDSVGLALHPDPPMSKVEAFAQAVETEFPAASFGADVEQANIEVWLEESYQLALSDSYLGVQEQQEPSQQYIDKTQAICRKRIALAGYRLGKALKAILH